MCLGQEKNFSTPSVRQQTGNLSPSEITNHSLNPAKVTSKARNPYERMRVRVRMLILKLSKSKDKYLQYPFRMIFKYTHRVCASCIAHPQPCI